MKKEIHSNIVSSSSIILEIKCRIFKPQHTSYPHGVTLCIYTWNTHGYIMSCNTKHHDFKEWLLVPSNNSGPTRSKYLPHNMQIISPAHYFLCSSYSPLKNKTAGDIENCFHEGKMLIKDF